MVAQDLYSIGFLPAVNFNTKLSNTSSINFNYQQRNLFYRSYENKLNHSYILSDYTVIYGHKLGLYSKVSLGVLIRFRDNQLVSRTLQQYSTIKQLPKLRLVNRLRLDQTYLPNFVAHRLRYRIGLEVPLNGTEVDTKEFYVKINNEYLNSISENEYDLETRLIFNLGFVVNKRNKLELGLDYRLANLVSQPLEHSFWGTFSLFLNIK